jgi:twitching motility protein PilT
VSFVPSLLQAIVQLDGEAVVLHVGEKPYVVTPTGQVDLATRGLTLDAVTGIISQLLPIETQRALDELGAAQYALPPITEMPREHFMIVAARGGDDIWLEIRRRQRPEDERPAVEVFEQAEPAAEPEEAEETIILPPAAAAPPPPSPPPPVPTLRRSSEEALDIPDATQLFPAHERSSFADESLTVALDQVYHSEPRAPLSPPAAFRPPAVRPPAPHFTDAPAPAPKLPSPPLATPRPAPLPPPPAARPAAAAPPPIAPPQPSPPMAYEPPAPQLPPGVSLSAPPAPSFAPPHVRPVMTGGPRITEPAISTSPTSPAVVLPLARNPIRPETPPSVADQVSSLDRLLRLAAARGASMLYLSSEAYPAVRVDGDVQTLDGTPVLSANDVEALLLTLMPERSAEALRTGIASEWIVDIADVGRVRCMSFRDHLGPGGVFRMMPTRAVSAEQLALSREVQALAIEPEGLMLFAGPRSSGKRTLMSAFVDLINRSRRDHVITIESEINVVHERSGSLISQREVRGSSDEMLTMARAALREDPDVLVLEEVRSAGLMTLALDAAASGQLVVGGFPAHNAAGAIDRIIDLYPPEYRRQVQLSLAQNLRGVVAQVLLRRNGGGRVAAREVLLNTPAVRSVLAEGKTSQLPLVIEGGRVHGMTPLNDALVGYVQNGIVDVREAYRRAADRAGFLAMLKRYGVDTTPIERYA